MTVLDERQREAVAEQFSRLERPVAIALELGPEEIPVTVLAGGRELDFGAETRTLLGEVAGLSDDIELTITETTEPGRYPATTIGGRLRYLGLPWGYELAALVGAIVEAGRSTSSLSTASLQELGSIERAVAVDVYVTPT